jgi:hypothetical protein
MRALMAVALAAATMLPGAAGAESPDARSQCNAREGVSSEQKLSACTVVIESGQEIGLVAAFNSRGNVHLGNQSYDRAIADYDAAIRIDPNYAIAFSNRGLA